MLEHLTTYFKAVHRFRRSERQLARGAAIMDLEELKKKQLPPRMVARINTVLNQHYATKRSTTAK
ncbi:hypothetical protein [Sphingomonas jaspsi]|uniref:hypothetical protein n=1 Tax=Sphingomonas jaspsi TaxID=392409 RepID=UPI0012EBCE7F|nr:hypothetical protein [Sphingomonas jaspsi]